MFFRSKRNKIFSRSYPIILGNQEKLPFKLSAGFLERKQTVSRCSPAKVSDIESLTLEVLIQNKFKLSIGFRVNSHRRVTIT